MEYNDFIIVMRKKKLKFKDVLNKIPDSRGGYYSTKSGLWKAMNISEKRIQNCKNIINFLLENM